MKTLYVTRGNNIYLDPQTNNTGRINSCRLAIDYIYRIPEKMHIIYQLNDYKKEFDAEPGDILITFYEGVFSNKAILVRNDDWNENIAEYERKEQLAKEKWAKDCSEPSDEKESY